MYKVLIIDDEEPSREAIRILGDWQRHGVGEVLEAGDGKAGLDLLRLHKPDLVLVDMKMPEMDGMTFLQTVELEFPNLFIIVISGFNDFEFTRQAIRSRVVDYLLKPVNRQDLNQALGKAVGVLEARKDTENEFINRNITLNMSLPKLKENIYLSIIERSFKARSNEAYVRLIGADDPSKRFGAASLRILNLEEIARRRFNNETSLLHFAVTNVVDEFSEEGFQSFSYANPKQEREVVVIHTMAGGYPEDMTFRSAHFMKKVVVALAQLFEITAVAGVGAPGADIGKLADAYELAHTTAGHIDVGQLGEVSVAQALHPDGKELSFTGSRLQQIRGAIEAGHANQVRGIVQQFTGQIRVQGGIGLDSAYRLAGELAMQMSELAFELAGVPKLKAGSGGESELRAAGLSVDFTTFEGYESLLCRIVDYYAGRIREHQATERPFDVAEIKAYIDLHYFEDIKISMFTDKYFLSREYLMKLFKQQYGFGIHEYVQKVRMDKAKELLDHSELKIQEISEMLGYKDKNYFSKAFRNYFSLSPSEYRMRETDGKR